jgi:hypothetical protein
MKLSVPDDYGQVHAIETDADVAKKLDEFEAELARRIREADATTAAGWLLAQQHCPNLVNDDDHKLMFLRCEVYRVNDAVDRLLRYWNQRVALFGLEKAFLPITWNGALSGEEDRIALRYGYCRIVKVLTKQKTTTMAEPARTLVLYDPSRQDPTQYPRESMVRAMWYMVHAAIDPSSSTAANIVMLCNFRDFHRSADRQLARALLESMKRCLPIRVAAYHVCHPTPLLRVLAPFVLWFLGSKARQRIRIHTGSEADVLQGLLNQTEWTIHDIPTDLGGTVQVNHEQWLRERIRQDLYRGSPKQQDPSCLL